MNGHLIGRVTGDLRAGVIWHDPALAIAIAPRSEQGTPLVHLCFWSAFSADRSVLLGWLSQLLGQVPEHRAGSGILHIILSIKSDAKIIARTGHSLLRCLEVPKRLPRAVQFRENCVDVSS